MDKTTEFYTLKGYQNHTATDLSAAMEDYLEMICRLLQKNAVVRSGELAGQLHVKPSSACKMIQQLNGAGYIHSEKYGYITLTEKGKTTGDYLLYRHDVLQRFLCLLNRSEDELEQVEKIEHFLAEATVRNLDALTMRMEAREKGNLP